MGIHYFKLLVPSAEAYLSIVALGLAAGAALIYNYHYKKFNFSSIFRTARKTPGATEGQVSGTRRPTETKEDFACKVLCKKEGMFVQVRPSSSSKKPFTVLYEKGMVSISMISGDTAVTDEVLRTGIVPGVQGMKDHPNQQFCQQYMGRPMRMRAHHVDTFLRSPERYKCNVVGSTPQAIMAVENACLHGNGLGTNSVFNELKERHKGSRYKVSNRLEILPQAHR